MTRIGSVLTGMLALMLLTAGCTGGEQAASVRTAASPRGTRTLTAAYLAIASHANHRLDTEVDGFTDHEHGDVAAARSDLRAEAATEQRFDRLLGKMGFRPRSPSPPGPSSRPTPAGSC